MNGPEHYREAERLLRLAGSTDWTTEHEPYRNVAVATAQAHATLALAAATIDAAAHPHQSVVDYLSPWWNAQEVTP